MQCFLVKLVVLRCLTSEVQTESKFFNISNLGNKDEFFRIDFYAIRLSDPRIFILLPSASIAKSNISRPMSLLVLLPYWTFSFKLQAGLQIVGTAGAGSGGTGKQTVLRGRSVYFLHIIIHFWGEICDLSLQNIFCNPDCKGYISNCFSPWNVLHQFRSRLTPD